MACNDSRSCPWINSCVGHRNVRYFLLFLCYLLVGSVYCSFMGFPLIMTMRSVRSWGVGYPLSFFLQHGLPRITDVVIFVIFAEAVAVSTALLPLIGMQLYLAVTNQTAVEFSARRSRKRSETVCLHCFQLQLPGLYDRAFGIPMIAESLGILKRFSHWDEGSFYLPYVALNNL